jgi:hypothetical protein
MFMFDHKRAMSSIMASRKKDDQEYGPVEVKNESVKDEDGEIDGRHLAAQDALAAIKEGSAAKFMDALSSFHDLHQAKKFEAEAENEPEDEE